MAKSTAKAESLARDLKDRLKLRDFVVAESKDSEGYPRLVLDTDQASIEIKQADAVSKDILGLDLKAFAPHELTLAMDDAVTKQEQAKIMLEVIKMGVDKLIVKSGADLATAEASAGEEIIQDVRWPSKGV